MVNAIVTQQVPKKVLDKAVFGDARIYEELGKHSDGKKALRRYRILAVLFLFLYQGFCYNPLTSTSGN